MELSITRARAHIAAGQEYLTQAERARAVVRGEIALTSLAQAHFAAASAICDVLQVELLSAEPLQVSEAGHLE